MIILTPKQLENFNNLVYSGDYPGAYNYLADIVRSTPGADPRVANWLETAAHINANDGSPYSEFVRAATQEAGHDIGNPISDQAFQDASDRLAETVFDALADLDSNNDGVFNAEDTEYANVQIWQDADQDGISDEGELTTLAEAGIASIDLDAHYSTTDLGDGNVQSASARYTTTTGEIRAVANLDFAHNGFYSEFTDRQSSVHCA